MKIIIQLLALLLILCSCASNEIDQQTAGIKNEDFKAPAKVHYRPRQDYYKTVLMGDDVLASETMARAGKDQLNSLGSSTDLLANAVRFCYSGDYERAEQAFDSIYRQFSKNPSFWNQLATCYFQQKKFSKANLYYLKALDYKKNYVPAINNIGVIYSVQGDEQKALAAFQKAMGVAADARTPRYNLAQLYLKYGMTRKARTHLDLLFKKNMTDINVIAAIATSYLMEGSLKSSLQYYSKIKESEFEKASIGLNYAVLLKLLGRTKEASKIIKKIDRRTISEVKNYYSSVVSFIGI